MRDLVVQYLATAMDRAWAELEEAVAGLTEAEYRWQPSPDAFTLAELLPPASEDWRSYFAKMPRSGQLSTIEYKVAHVATCKVMYAEYAFRHGQLQWRWADLDVPRNLSEMIHYLERAHLELKNHVADLEDEDLPAARKTNWGDLWPTERILWTLIAHDIYHGAQIRTMRALYRASNRVTSEL